MNDNIPTKTINSTVSLKQRDILNKACKIMSANWQLYVLLLPAFIYVLIFSYQPMYGVQIAFKDYRTSLGIWKSEWVGLKHFIRFVTFPNFWLYVKNTVAISVYGMCTFPCSIILALLINELQNVSFKRTVQMITYAPHFISTVVICGMVLIFFNRSSGIVNTLIELLGGTRIDFMSEPRYFRSIYVWSGVWQGVGWGTIIYLAALAGVPSELVEAARIDGANRFHIIWHVNIPSIQPTIIILLIMNFGSILSVGFEKIYLLQNPLNLSVSQVISTYTYQIGLVGGQYSYSSAIGLFNTVVNILLLIIVNIIIKKISSISLW